MLSLLLAVLLAAPLSFAPPVAASAPAAEAPVQRVEFRLKNDTGEKVRIHTGTGTSSINNGSTNRYTADEGQEFRLFDGSKGDLLFEVDAEMDGETLKLSDYL
ncbi:MAG: hypothetical protein AAGI52_02685 [Bacteroidota bacterium]